MTPMPDAARRLAIASPLALALFLAPVLAGCSGHPGAATDGGTTSPAVPGCGPVQQDERSDGGQGVTGRANARDHDGGGRWARWDLVAEPACQAADAEAVVDATLLPPPQGCPAVTLDARLASGPRPESPILLQGGGNVSGRGAIRPSPPDFSERASVALFLVARMPTLGSGAEDDACMDAQMQSFRLRLSWRAAP